MDNIFAYKVYVLTDSNGNITAVNSSACLPDATGWTQIDEGMGDKYQYPGGNYFDRPFMTISGVYLYRLVNGVAVKKTDEEISAEEAAIPAPGPTPTERIASLESAASDADAMMVDQEYRLILLELGVV